MRLEQFISVVLVAIFCFVGCEGKFAGDRDFSLTTVNGPFRLKFVKIGSTSYLASLNTNYRFESDKGSIHFYSLSDPQNPVLDTTLSIPVDYQVGDFEVVDDTLIVADRGVFQLFFYDLSGGRFVQRVNANGQPVKVEVTSNPQRLIPFTRLSDNKKILAVVCQLSGVIHFLKLDSLELLSEGSQTPTRRDTVVYDDKVGANLYVTARRLENPPRADPVSLSSSEAGGFGINAAGFLPSVGTEQIFVTASSLATIVFGYRFESFENSANLTWNLSRSKNGYRDESLQKVYGTKEDGFRGLGIDESGSVYLSSRADNSIYKISRSDFERAKDFTDSSFGRNTNGFTKDTTPGRLIQLDDNPYDKVFPRLGDLTIDCPETVDALNFTCSGDAQRLWTLGLGSKKVYRVDLSVSPATSSVSGELLESPQSILWHPTADILYVAQPKINRIEIIDADSLVSLGHLGN